MKAVIAAFLLSIVCFAQDSTKQPIPKIFEIPTADVYTRYRYIDNNAGNVTADDLQYRFTGRFRVNVPKTGTYFGSRLSLNLDETLLRRLFAAFLVILAINLAMKKPQPTDTARVHPTAESQTGP